MRPPCWALPVVILAMHAMLASAAQPADRSDLHAALMRRANATVPEPIPWRASKQATAATGGGKVYVYYDCTPHEASAPKYGAASTMASGNKLCPFNPTSTVCSNAQCYFYRVTVDSGQYTRICPVAFCDNLIKSYCASLVGGVKGSDLGCQVMTRQRPTGEVGVGPFVDWLDRVNIQDADAFTQTPSVYVEHTNMKGGMSSKELTLTLSTTTANFLTKQTAFIAAVAGILKVPKTSIFIIPAPTGSGSTTTVKLQIVGQALGSVASKFTGTVGGLTVSSSSETDKTRTNRCYAKTTITKDCPADPMEEVLKTSDKARSGVWSLPAGDFSNTDDLIGAGTLVGFVWVTACLIIWVALSCGT